MSFNTALTGIRAASDDLQITGNNIANASTIGFKSSRAEFGDVYAASVLGVSGNVKGTGVRLLDTAQQFTQGSINSTDNVLDMAVAGRGFFVVSQGGQQLYTRAGNFGLDKDGFLVTKTDAFVRGYLADDSGNIGGVLSNLQVPVNNQPPRQTTLVQSNLNLDSTKKSPVSTGLSFSTTGGAIGVAQSGQATSTPTMLGTTAPQTVPYDFATNPGSFDITVSGAADPTQNGTVTVNLNKMANSVAAMASQINQAIASANPNLGVQAVAVDTGGGVYQLQFQAVTAGDPSTVAVSNFSGSAGAGAPLNLDAGASTAGVAAVNNGYPAQYIDIVDSNGNSVTYHSQAGASAAQTASELTQIPGVDASATTTATLLASGYNNTGGNMVITLNGVNLTSNSLSALQSEINSLTNVSLPGISAALNNNGDLVITSATGSDLDFTLSSTDAADSLQVEGASGTSPVTLDLAGGNQNAVVGGTINLLLDSGYSVANPSPALTGLFGAITNNTFTPVTINAFDPNNPQTYNNATSMTIFDSLGNEHVLTQYFVKDPATSGAVTNPPNTWTMYVLIDGKNVGDPNATLPAPQNTQPTLASFKVRFNQDGSFNPLLSSSMLISNWIPLDANGQPNGAMGPLNQLSGGTLPVPTPPTSSNFQINMAGSTQFGSAFATNDVKQDGYTTGRLASIDVDKNGVIFTRFTNDQNRIIGQIALARFNNEQGLNPTGSTMWGESYESGQPNIGTPGSSALGSIQSSGLEDSNVDLSEQLVHLIIAQRNFQASAKTIETENQVTQTIINLR